MAHCGKPLLTLIHAGFLLAIVSFPDFLGAIPVEQHSEEQAPAVSSDVRAKAMTNLKKLVRNRRNVPAVAMPQFQHPSDFWGLYKYFADTHNQEGVEDMDRLYLAYLQNKHRSEKGSSFHHYLKHLSEVYKACAESEDPECIAEFTSRPKAAMVMSSPVKSSSVSMCNPHLDPYCPYPGAPKAADPEPAPVAAKGPGPAYSPPHPMSMKSSGSSYYAPILEPFLSAEQRSELLRICNPQDVECLQYHLRAAYGYLPAAGPAPSYAALNCDPNDPYCMPHLVQKAPSGFYHRLSSCDPAVDPLCALSTPLSPDAAPKEQHCNPLFDAGCNPLRATKLSALTKGVAAYTPKGQPVPPAAPMTCDPRYDPYCIMSAAAALRNSKAQVHSRLGIRGKTREGYDCYVHYDKDCTPVEDGPWDKADIRAPTKPFCHPYDPDCSKFSSPLGATSSRPSKDRVILPDPDCDPEYDYNCRLRRAEPAEGEGADAVPQSAVARFEDFLRGVMSESNKF